jgi:hypothetical protein
VRGGRNPKACSLLSGLVGTGSHCPPRSRELETSNKCSDSDCVTVCIHRARTVPRVHAHSNLEFRNRLATIRVVRIRDRSAAAGEPASLNRRRPRVRVRVRSCSAPMSASAAARRLRARLRHRLRTRVLPLWMSRAYAQDNSHSGAVNVFFVLDFACAHAFLRIYVFIPLAFFKGMHFLSCAWQVVLCHCATQLKVGDRHAILIFWRGMSALWVFCIVTTRRPFSYLAFSESRSTPGGRRTL